MGRLELLYTSLSNLVNDIKQDGIYTLPEKYDHYHDSNDRNKVVYHDRETSTADIIQKVIDDAAELLQIAKDEYSENRDYQLLLRAITEQNQT
jgi:hypothetical protein